MSEYASSRTERVANAAKAKAEAAKAEAEAQAAKVKAEADARSAQQSLKARAAKTATDELAEQVKQANLKKRLDATRAEAREAGDARRGQRTEERQEAGTAFRQLVTAVVVLGLAAALPAQISYFLGLGKNGPAWMMLPVPLFLELLAWVGVLGTAWAHRKGLARWPFWILTGALASIAGFINATHGVEQFGAIAGVGLAATSVIGPLLWEARQYLESAAAADTRDVAQRAKDKVAAKKAAVQAKADKEQAAAQDEKRQEFFPEQWNRYEKILATRPAGSIAREDAWAEADRAVLFGEVWEVYDRLLSANPFTHRDPARMWADAWHRVYGLPLGITPESLAIEIGAQQRVEDVMQYAGRRPEQVAVDFLLRDVFPPDPGGDTGGSQALGGNGDTGPRPSAGTAATKPSDPATTLGRKGKRASGRTAPKTPQKPLAEADLEKVRVLADALGTAAKLSLGNVRSAVGGGSNDYLVRLRDAVRGERR
jgi:hypothetical protein